MAKTTLEVFRKELLATGSYTTPPERRAKKRRKPGFFTTLGFSFTVFNVFPLSGIAEAMGRLTTDLWAHYCFRCVQKAERYGMDVFFDGWENRQKHDGPVIYLANHMSTLETVLLPFVLLTYGPFNVVVKQSLSHLPFLEKAAAHMGLIPVGRKNPREDLMQMFTLGKERVEQGNSILIFAQGTRQKVFSRKHWSSIGSKLAEKAGVPVVPIALQTDCEPTREGGGPFKDFGPVDTSLPIRFRCGPVITGSSREMQQASYDWIAAQLKEWGLPVEEE